MSDGTPIGDRYRWLARKTAATRHPRHVFIEDGDLSLCRYASRYGAVENWVQDPEREQCRTCLRYLAAAVEKRPALTEVPW